MSATDLPDRRGLYFLNTTPPPVLTQTALAAMDTADEGAFTSRGNGNENR